MRQRLTRVPSVAVWVLIALGTSSALIAGSTPVPGPRRVPLPDERLGVRTAPLLLLSRPDVCADLRLNPRQLDEAEEAITDLYIRAAALRGQVGQPAIAGRKAIDEAQRVWFETHLTTEQLNRLVQIDLQWEGPSALLSRPVVADTLSLSTEQRVALKQAVAARDAARARGSAPGAAEQVLARQALSQLTPEQKVRWRAMLGNPFVPRLASGGDGRRSAR